MKAPMCGKIINLCAPAAIKDNAAWVFNGDGVAASAKGVDTKGFRWARFRFQLGATDIAMTAAIKIQESDSEDMSSAVDITGAALADAISATEDDKIFQIDVPLEGRKRYLRPAATAGDGTAGTYMAATVELFGAEIDAENAAAKGLHEWIVAN